MVVTTMNVIFLRLMFIIYIMIVIPGSLCKECSSLMGDDNRNYLEPVINLQESCCFVNECMYGEDKDVKCATEYC